MGNSSSTNVQGPKYKMMKEVGEEETGLLEKEEEKGETSMTNEAKQHGDAEDIQCDFGALEVSGSEEMCFLSEKGGSSNPRNTFSLLERTRYWILHSPSVGIVYAVLSTVLMAIGHFFAQINITSTKDFPELEVTFIRCVGQIITLTPILLLFKSRVWYGCEKFVLLFLLSLSGYACYIIAYYVLKLIPLSILLSISGTVPIFATFLSICILKEPCEWLEGLSGVVSVIGVLLITRPTFLFGEYGKKEHVFYPDKSNDQYEVIYLTGCGLAILFAVARALYLVLGRKWSKMLDKEGEKPNQIVTPFYPSVLGVIMTPFFMMFSGEGFVLPKDLTCILTLPSVGVITAFGLMFLMLALKTQNATVVGIIRNLEVIWAFLLQYMFFGVVPGWWNVGGAAVIILATVMVLVRENLESVSQCTKTKTDS